MLYAWAAGLGTHDTALVAGTSTLDIRSAGRMSMLQLTLDDNKKTRSNNHLEICCLGLLFSWQHNMLRTVLINPRRACAAVVTVVVLCVCVCVRACVCVRVSGHAILAVYVRFARQY